jgi:exodeoxyribonuclease VII large subunit
LGERWGGLRVDVAHVQVQGEAAADQMIRALKHLNTQEVLPEVIVLLRGGGSADDLSAFNDELLVREIAASRVPVLTGIGHEIDESLADLAADRAASTPSNAAQLLVPDKREIIARANHMVQPIIPTLLAHVESTRGEYTAYLDRMEQLYSERHSSYERELALLGRMVEQFNPAAALARGYSVVRGEVAKGSSIEIEQLQRIITAEVTNVKNK